MRKPKVAFVCVHNSCRSQIAEALGKKLAVDVVITMGCNVQCPFLPCSHREDWGLEDPSGFSWYGGQYHLFYQYRPYSSVWGPMHWGHAVSRDLVRWEYLPVIMAPDTPCDSFVVFSGTAALDVEKYDLEMNANA